MERVYDVIVLGGGLNGLSTLYQLARMGTSNAALIEQFHLGHERGSSHGHSRVSRTAYRHVDYVGLMKVARAEEWPRLEADAGRTLVHPSPGCFFGPPGGRQEGYWEASSEELERLDASEASSRFPQLRFEPDAVVLSDRGGALVAAAHTIESLIELGRRSADLIDNTPVLDVDLDTDPIRLSTANGTLLTERLVVAAGPWTSRLLPFLEDRLKVVRQTVGFFRFDADPSEFELGKFPVWGNLGRDGDRVYYGLPPFGREGVKVAEDRHLGDHDPDEIPDEDQQAIQELRDMIASQFVAPAVELLGSEICYYTNSDTEDFILDLHPDNPNVVIGSSFSGHSFKFGPLTGRILAELVLNGRTTVPEFQSVRQRFAVKPSSA